jgi:hypothetical protein
MLLFTEQLQLDGTTNQNHNYINKKWLVGELIGLACSTGCLLPAGVTESRIGNVWKWRNHNKSIILMAANGSDQIIIICNL